MYAIRLRTKCASNVLVMSSHSNVFDGAGYVLCVPKTMNNRSKIWKQEQLAGTRVKFFERTIVC